VAGYETFDWMSGLFKDETPRQRKLRLAACLLRDVWWNEHPDYRAEQAFLRVLRLPFLGLGHEDRAGLALALFFRYGREPTDPTIKQAQALLEDGRLHRVRTVGLAMRLSYALSAGAPKVLPRTLLEVSGARLVLTVPDNNPMFKSGSFERRLERLAEHMGLTPKVERA
jgi:exopolyphosphatase/guanosine-5'-triphosphate,3'-diphosphate pyrophosphatase